MDFVRLGEAYTTKYVADMLIEGYNSLIWTERFFGMGEFELKSFDVDGLLAALPEDTLVSHLETREVMRVETVEINEVGEGADAQPEITIKGRSATSIFEDRWVESNYQKKRRMRKKYSATSAAGVLMWQAVDNASGKDVTRGDTDPDTEAMQNDYSWNTKDVIPNVAITESVAAEGETRWWQLEEGMLLPQLMRILDNQDLSIRCLRPISGLNPGTVITVKTALSERGTIVRTQNSDIKQLRFDIYHGNDKTNTVQFSQLQGHLDKPHYLTSTKDSKTVVEMMSGEVYVGDVYRDGEENLTGWQRRTMGFDAGTPELPDEPERPEDPRSNATREEKEDWRKAIDTWRTRRAKWKNKKAAIVADFREEQTKAARKELRNARRINMFAGDISSLSPYQYKVHYDLGDKVKLVGDYGRTTNMIVAEYVRTEDANGERGFPGLVEP